MSRLKAIGTDEETQWIQNSLQGDKESLQKLISLHQDWVYQIAFRMTGHTQDSEDAVQEIMIRMVTHLSSFKGKSRFRTWLYRLAVNHILDMKKSPMEYMFSSLEQHNQIRQWAGKVEFTDPKIDFADKRMLIEETKSKCLMGMLICLDRDQRMIFILGGILQVESAWGAELVDTSPAAFRKQLQRARDHLSNYINNNCSLLNPNATCICSHKTKAALNAGYIDPDHMVFNRKHLKRAKDYLENNTEHVADLMSGRLELLFQKQEIHPLEDITHNIMIILERKGFQDILNYH